MKKQALGKGLGALFPENIIDELNTSSYDLLKLHPDLIFPNPFQPRKVFNDEELESLKNSILIHGVIQPIVVRKVKDKYEIVAGERRWRASKLAGIDEIPTLVISDDDQKAYEVALVENIQRVELNPIEEALAYETLINKYDITHTYLSSIVGKSRSQISNTLRLLQLVESVKDALSSGRITVGHARALIPLDKITQELLLEKITTKGLSVRDVENLVSKSIKTEPNKPESKKEDITNNNIHYLNARQDLADYFGTKVIIDSKEKSGKVVIEFYGDEDLERIISLIVK